MTDPGRGGRRQPLRLFAVVVVHRRTGAIDRVLLNAARTSRESAAMARAFYRVDRPPPRPFRFAAQPITEVSGPGGAVYRIALERLPDDG